MTVEIKLNKKVKLDGYTLFEGFPGIGLVGTIASGYMVEKLKMKPIGYVYSNEFPPMTTVHKGTPYFPARFYIDKKNKILILLAEFVIPTKTVYELSEALLDFAKKNKIKQIVSLAGMTTPQKQEINEIYGIAANKKVVKFLEKNGIKLIKEGVTTGVSGVLISMCATNNIDAMSLLSQSKYGYPDPESAADLIDKLNELYGIKIETKELRKEAGNIQSKMKGMLQRMKKKQTGPQATGKQNYPSMYE